MRRSRAAAALATFVLVASACREPKRPAPVQRTDIELLRSLAVLATSASPNARELETVRRQIDAGTLTLAEYVDRLLATREFANDVAPLIVLRQLLSQNATAAPLGAVLKQTDAGNPVFYLHDRCAPEQAVSVVPWWNLVEGRSEPVAICPDAYRPDKWMADVADGQTPTACLSLYGSDSQPCGCGPNLIRCFKSADQSAAMMASLRDELRRTVAFNISRRSPLAQIFTSNETFRDRNAEFLMRTYVAEAARRPLPESALRDLASWPAEGKWAAREDLAPGENAGILTSPQLVHFTLDRRQRMTALYDALWCVEPNSVGASPESLLSITGANLQLGSDGWKELAARPVCTGCHARLDYGFQFFWGFPNGNVQAFFDPTLQKTGKGPLYVNDIDDPRGEAELNPKGFAGLAVGQPEFRHCMARDFGEYVLGHASSPSEIATLEASIRSDKTSGYDLMRQAMLLLIKDWDKRGPALAPVAAGREQAPAAAVAVTGKPKQVLEQACLDCHEHEDGRPDFATPNIDRKTVVSMLEAVASGSMPKVNPLSEDERRAFLETFIDAIWSGKDAVAARDYFIGGGSIPVFRPEVAFALIHERAGSKTSSPWRMVENAVRPNEQQLTPGFAAVTGLETIEACKHVSAREQRSRCISDAFRLAHMTGRSPSR